MVTQKPGLRERFLDFLSRRLNQFSDDHRRARSYRRAAVRHHRRVRLRDRDALVRKPQRLGRNLAEHGIGSLAKFRAGHQHSNSAVGMGFHTDHRIQIVFAGARESRAVQKSRDPHSFFAHSVFIFFRKTRLLRGVVR